MPESVIRIKLKNMWSYEYDTDDYEMLTSDSRKCSYCGDVWFDTVYCYIIDCLKEAGLLHEDFEEICCCCLVLRRFGLLDLRHKLIAFTYVEEDDYLLVELSYRENLTVTISRYRVMLIGIHSWSKIKLFK